jgi:hypothetical protein
MQWLSISLFRQNGRAGIYFSPMLNGKETEMKTVTTTVLENRKISLTFIS